MEQLQVPVLTVFMSTVCTSNPCTNHVRLCACTGRKQQSLCLNQELKVHPSFNFFLLNDPLNFLAYASSHYGRLLRECPFSFGMIWTADMQLLIDPSDPHTWLFIFCTHTNAVSIKIGKSKKLSMHYTSRACRVVEYVQHAKQWQKQTINVSEIVLALHVSACP